MTEVGQAKVARAKALGQNIYLWQMTVSSRTPDGMQEHYRATIHQLKLEKGRVTARFVLPSGVGDWRIDQVGLLDRDGDLLALQSLPFSKHKDTELPIEMTLETECPSPFLLGSSSIEQSIWDTPILIEGQTIGQNQRVVELSCGTTDKITVYVNGKEERDLAILGPRRFRLPGNYPPNSRVWTIQSARELGNSRIVSEHLASYTGIQSDPAKWSGDHGSRVYILPQDQVTEGAGGVIKLFGDAYQKNQDYRDLGIYFYADQKGDRGQHGNGVFWFNSKVGPSDSSLYGYGNPDLGFSFQDGDLVAGRIVRLGGGTNQDRAVWVIGPRLASLALGSHTIGMEFDRRDVAFCRGFGIRFPAKNNKLENGILGKEEGIEVIAEGKTGALITNQGIQEPLAFARISLTDTKLDLLGKRVVRVSAPTPVVITDLCGIPGQVVTLVFTDGNVGISSSAGNIHLQDAQDLLATKGMIGGGCTLTLCCCDDSWYEVSRSVNS